MEVSIFVAKNNLSELLTKVVHGAEVTITRRGVPIARIVPLLPAFDHEKARRAAAGLRQASRGVTLGGIEFKDLVGEGRP
jgi:prevent-host-death family protein